jgi:hypothetical protein
VGSLKKNKSAEPSPPASSKKKSAKKIKSSTTTGRFGSAERTSFTGRVGSAERTSFPKKESLKKSKSPLKESPFLFQEPSFSYPMHYGYDQVTLLVRDPHWIFAYWSLTEETLDHLKERYADEKDFEKIKLTLRVFDGSEGFSSKLLQEIFPMGNSVNYYIQVFPNQKCYCDIGFLTGEGEFLHIARSNLVETPTDRFSQNRDDSRIAEISKTALHRVGDNKVLETKQKNIKQKLEKNLSSNALSSASISSRAFSVLPLSSEALSSSRLSSGALSSGALSSGVFAKIAGSSSLYSSLSSGVLSSFSWSSSSSSSLEEMSLSSLSSGVFSSSFSSTSLSFGGITKDVLFPFSMDSKMLLYGHTDPQASLYVQGVKKKVNPDGTFSVPLTISKEQFPLSTISIKVVMPNGEELSFDPLSQGTSSSEKGKV